MKNILLGSVAGLAMVGSAAAADLPVKARAAEYVKICSTYGAGFYYIPGSDTCLKVGGYVTADFYALGNEVNVRSGGVNVGSFTTDAHSYFKTRAAIQLDARTQTEYGTLRSYIEGRFEYGEDVGLGQDDNGQFSFQDNSTNRTILKYGYIQFAGFTFGKATSAFDFWAGDGWYGIDPGSYYSDTTSNVIQYTADFGNGFSATIAIEDAVARETTGEDAFFIGEAQQIPDIVANIAYEGTWGAAKLSGAWHQIGDQAFNDVDESFFVDADTSGWAALAGVRFDIAETTTMYIEGAYADGAPGYLGLAGTLPNVDAAGNTVAGWYVGGMLSHYWTPTVFTGVVGSYTESDTFETFTGTQDFTGYNVGANIGWQPVKGLTLVLQYDYLEAEFKSLDFADSVSGAVETSQNRVTFSAKRSF